MRQPQESETTVATDVRQASLKDLARQVLERQPIAEDVASRRALAKALEAAQLGNYRAALLLGRLHVCCNCSAFQFGGDPAGLGHCRGFGVEAWPFLPFWCSGFETSPTPVAPAILPDPDGARARVIELAKPTAAEAPFDDPLPDLASEG